MLGSTTQSSGCTGSVDGVFIVERERLDDHFEPEMILGGTQKHGYGARCADDPFTKVCVRRISLFHYRQSFIWEMFVRVLPDIPKALSANKA